MFGRKTPELTGPNLSSGRNPYNEIQNKSGKTSGNQQRKEIIYRYPQQFVFRVIGLSGQFSQTIVDQLEWSELVTCFGVEVGQESHGELGKRREWKLTVKIPGQSFGMVMGVKRMLSSMNLEEVSMLRTCCDGWIVTQFEWKSKDQANLYCVRSSGSPQTCRPESGTQI